MAYPQTVDRCTHTDQALGLLPLALH
eukprot:SAG25_NODE_7152_length_501_cov_0.967662_2_plen_25_part_01